MSQRYTVGCSTPVPHTCVFLWPCSIRLLGVPYLPQRLPSNPRQPNSPFHILVRPLLCADISSKIHKVLRLLQFLSFHLQARLLVSFSQKLALCCLHAYLHAHFLAHLCDFCQRLLYTFPVRRVRRCHAQISNLLSFHLRCQPLR